MKLNKLKNTILAAAFGLIALLGTSQVTRAQGNKEDQRQKQKVEKQQQKAQQLDAKREDTRIKSDQHRESTRLRNMPRGTANADNNRFRVSRDGAYYQTD